MEAIFEDVPERRRRPGAHDAAMAGESREKWWPADRKTPLSTSERQLIKELHAAIDSTRSVQDDNLIETDITPLHFAVLLGRPDLLERCLDAGSFVDEVTPKYGMTPSLLACCSGQGACLKVLAERGADLTLEDNAGRTHADFCAVHCHRQCMRVLESFDLNCRWIIKIITNRQWIPYVPLPRRQKQKSY